MACRVVETEAVRRDLLASLYYLEFVLGQQSSATRLAEAYLEFVSNVAKFPAMYPEVQEVRLKAFGYRKALVNGYIVLYKIETEGGADRIVVARLFHQSQDYARLV